MTSELNFEIDLLDLVTIGKALASVEVTEANYYDILLILLAKIPPERSRPYSRSMTGVSSKTA